MAFKRIPYTIDMNDKFGWSLNVLHTSNMIKTFNQFNFGSAI